MPKKKRVLDFKQTAVSVVRAAAGTESLRSPHGEPSAKAKNEAAALLGRLGGLKGGKARAKKLSRERRREIARMAGIASGKSRRKTGLSISK